MAAFGAAQTADAGGAQGETLQRKIDDDERTFDGRRAHSLKLHKTLVSSAQTSTQHNKR